MKKIKWLAFVVLLLIILRLALPAIGLRVVNSQLEKKLGSYVGSISDFDLSLFRGAYQLQGLQIKKKNSRQKPLLLIDEIELSIAWRALLHKRVSADVKLHHPRLNLIDSQKDNVAQLGRDEPTKNWRDILDILVPTRFESLAIKNGEVEFTNHDFKAPIPIRLDRIELKTQNLRLQMRNVVNPLKFHARLQNHAQVEILGRASILEAHPTLDIDFKLENFQLASINRTLRAYLPLDITSGELNLYGELAGTKGKSVGYGKIFFKNGDIVAKKQKFINLKHFALEITAAASNWILQNNKNKSVAAVVPFRYENEKLDINSTAAFWSSVKNASGRIRPGIDGRISLDSIASLGTNLGTN
ncbi:MAG: DUF748 domain-containing protein [Pseudomonadota bacterium]|nr:DUF748 domain-containing protein [Pseudomonadota bacterium]